MTQKTIIVPVDRNGDSEALSPLLRYKMKLQQC